MRLFCLKQPNNVRNEPDADIDPTWQIEVGSEYNSIGEHNGNGGLCYFLAGKPENIVYNANLFATLPEATATEMYETEIEGILF